MILKQYQSTFDFSTQTSGDVKSVIAFCVLNGYSFTEEIPAGTEVLIPDTEYKSDLTLDYFDSKEIELATGETKADTIILGIGTMIIGSDFDVL